MTSPFRVRFEIQAPNIRDERGRFYAEGLRELRRENKEIGELLRAQVARRISNHVMTGPRASASSGRLVAVTAGGGNQHIDQRVGSFSVAVGVTSYLEKSTARYWRTFEEGSAAVWKRPFIGTQLVAQYYGGFGRGVPSPHGTSLLTAKGKIAFKGADDRFVVKREIAPAHVYRDVQAEAHLDLVNLAIARRFLDRIFTTPVKIFPPHGAPPAI